MTYPIAPSLTVEGSSNESQSGSAIRVYTANLIAELLNSTDVAKTSIETQILPAVGALLNDSDV